MNGNLWNAVNDILTWSPHGSAISRYIARDAVSG